MLSQYDQLIKPIMIINKILSIWPQEEDSNSFKLWLRTCHRVMVFLIVIVFAIAVTADFIHQRDNIEIATECALMATGFYLGIIRLVIYSIHQTNLSYIVQTMKDDWQYADKVEQEILEDKCVFVFKLSKYFIFTVIVTLMIFILIPILESIFLESNERKFPFRAYFFQSQTKSPMYECLYIFSVIAGSLIGSTICGATCLNLVVVVHGAVKFTIVRKKLETMKSMEDLIKCVKQHQNALLFAECVENTINILALGQFMISTGLLCFCGIQITKGDQDKSTTLKYSSFLNSAIFELLLFSYSGNELIVESSAIGSSSYASDWVGADFMKNIQLISMRSLVPSSITAGKFYNMSLASFASVLSSAFSYFTMLRSVNS